MEAIRSGPSPETMIAGIVGSAERGAASSVIRQEFHERLDPMIWKMTASTLAAEVIELARTCDLSLVTAESCTAGAVAHVLSEVPGAGSHLQGGFVAYSKEMKTKALGVSSQLLKQKTAVCAEVAEAMARGGLDRSPADVAVAVTGVAGPEPDEDGNPVGLVYCCAIRAGCDPIISKQHFKQMSHDDFVREAIHESLRLLKAVCEPRRCLADG